MNYNYQRQQKTAGIIRYSCGILFCLFCFTYLFFLQGELLAQAQFVYSRGVTNYSLFVGAFIITAVLQIVQWLVAKLAKTPSRWYVLTYFPSFLALTMLTHIDEQSINHFSFGAWKWLAPLLLILYVLLLRFLYEKNYSRESHQPLPIVRLLSTNYLLLLIMALLTAGTGTASDVYMFELKTERLLAEGQTDDALQVGRRSLQSSQRLTNLRMYALSLQDSLAEHLFDYPQAFGIDGLLTLSDSDQLVHRITSQDIACSLGMKIGTSIRTPQRYFQLVLEHHTELLDSLSQMDSLAFGGNDSLRLAHENRLQALRRQTRRTADYYLCSLLLQRDVIGFVDSYTKYHQRLYPDLPDSVWMNSEVLLPVQRGDVGSLEVVVQRAYREALVVGMPECADSLTLQRHQSYVEMRDSIQDPVVRQNQTRRRFGNTFWWYLDNPLP